MSNYVDIPLYLYTYIYIYDIYIRCPFSTAGTNICYDHDTHTHMECCRFKSTTHAIPRFYQNISGTPKSSLGKPLLLVGGGFKYAWNFHPDP